MRPHPFKPVIIFGDVKTRRKAISVVDRIIKLRSRKKTQEKKYVKI